MSGFWGFVASFSVGVFVSVVLLVLGVRLYAAYAERQLRRAADILDKLDAAIPGRDAQVDALRARTAMVDEMLARAKVAVDAADGRAERLAGMPAELRDPAEVADIEAARAAALAQVIAVRQEYDHNRTLLRRADTELEQARREAGRARRAARHARRLIRVAQLITNAPGNVREARGE